jgi:hypothetical protein
LASQIGDVAFLRFELANCDDRIADGDCGDSIVD